MGLADIQESESHIAPVAGPHAAGDDGVIDLQYLFVTWLKWVWVPVILGLVGLYVGYRDLQAFSPQSVASLTVLPSGAGAAQPAAVGGLAAQFGIQLGGQANFVSPIQRLEMLLGSIVLAERLQEQYGLLQIIFPGGWDSATQTWLRPTGPEFERSQRRRKFLRQNLWTPPNLESLANYVQGNVSIEAFDGGPFQRVSVTHQDPEFALWLLNTAYFGADNLLQEQDALESAAKKAYIQAQLDTETNVQIQDALRSLLAAELSREVTSNESPLFAAKIVEPARVSNQRTEPNIRRMFGVPMSGFAAVGFLLTTLIAVFRREKRRK